MKYLACEKCQAPVRVDDGSFINSRGEECNHFFHDVPTTKNTQSTTIIFRGPKGEISIPWEQNTPCPKGYVVEELHGTRAVRRLEKELDARDRQRYHDHQKKLAGIFAKQRAQRREDLKQIARDGVTVHEGRTIRVSEFGRALARERLRRLNTDGYNTNYDPGNYRRE